MTEFNGKKIFEATTADFRDEKASYLESIGNFTKKKQEEFTCFFLHFIKASATKRKCRYDIKNIATNCDSVSYCCLETLEIVDICNLNNYNTIVKVCHYTNIYLKERYIYEEDI
jgi:hypothetical protein